MKQRASGSVMALRLLCNSMRLCNTEIRTSELKFKNCNISELPDACRAQVQYKQSCYLQKNFENQQHACDADPDEC